MEEEGLNIFFSAVKDSLPESPENFWPMYTNCTGLTIKIELFDAFLFLSEEE